MKRRSRAAQEDEFRALVRQLSPRQKRLAMIRMLAMALDAETARLAKEESAA